MCASSLVAKQLLRVFTVYHTEDWSNRHQDQHQT